MPTVTTIASFPQTLSSPVGSLFMDSSGDLLGGEAFDISDSGFAPAPTLTPVFSSILWQNANGQASIWEDGRNDQDRRGCGRAPILAGSWGSGRNRGVFSPSGDTSDILWRNTSTGQAAIWEMDGNTKIGGGRRRPQSWAELESRSERAISTAMGNPTSCGKTPLAGRPAIWEMDGNHEDQRGAPSAPILGPAWKAIGTGDFNHDGFSDILWQNTSTGKASIWEMEWNKQDRRRGSEP